MKKENKKIIAVVGMAGSGKSEVIKYLQKKHSWPKVYFGDFTFERIKKEKLEVNYKNEKYIREKIREELGMGGYAKLALPKIEKLLKTNETILIESLYSWDEYKIIKEKYADNFITIAVYAPPAVRFERLLNRASERPIKNMQEFKTRDYSEIEGTDKGGPIASADITLINTSDLDELHKNLNNSLNKII